MTRLVTIELEEYNELLRMKEWHEKNMKQLQGHVAIPEEKYDYFIEIEQRIDKAINILNNPWSFESGNKEVDEKSYQKKREVIEILKGTNQ